MANKNTTKNILCQALQELKDAKNHGIKSEEKRVMRKLFSFEDGSTGLLISSINIFCNKKRQSIRLSEEDKSDLINQTFLDIYKKIDTLKDVNKGKGWCLSIFYNKYKDFLDRKYAKKREGNAEIVELDNDEENVIKDKLEHKAIEEDTLLSLSDREKDIVNCMQENFELFAKDEPDRALAVALRHQDVYDPRANYFKRIIQKFFVPIRSISSSENMKLSSAEISVILKKKSAAAVDTYISESKRLLRPYIQKCREI